MDADGIPYEEFRDCLHDLARVNVLSWGYRPTLEFLEGLRRTGRLSLGRPLEILDVGSGYGDLLRAVDAWARSRGIDVRMTGLDLNPWAARAAAATTGPGRPLRWVTGDLFSYAGRADVVLSSLFAHHLDDGRVVRFLRWMEDRAGTAWFVNDLHRHRLPATFFGPMAGALRLHPFVRHDGPVSFRRAFTPGEWKRLLAQADVPEAEAQVRRAFPFRLCVARAKPA